MMVLLLGIGQLGLRRMHDINATLSDITSRQSAKLQLTQEALMLSNNNSRIMMEIFLAQKRPLVDSLAATRSANTNEITGLLTRIEAGCESEKEKQLLSAIRETRGNYVGSYVRALHLLNEGKRNAATAIILDESLPSILKYHAAWRELEEFQQSQVDAAVRQSQVDYAVTRRFVSLMILLSVVLACVIAGFAIYGTTQDVEQGLQRSEERMRLAMEAANIGVWDLDVIQDEHVWSNICKALLGVHPDSPANFQVLMNSVHPDDRKMMQEEIATAIRERRDYFCEFRVVFPDGTVHWRSSGGRAFYDNSGQTTRMAGISMDIDERKQAEERLHLQAAALEAAANAIVITDSRGTIIWVNPAFTTMTGYSKEEALGKNPSLLKSGNQPEAYYAKMWSTISSGNVWQGELVNRRKDGTTYKEEMTITPVKQRAGNGVTTQFVAIKQDITHRKAAEDQVEFLAYHDALTGLPNRALLQDRLAKAIAGARRRKDKVALLFLDLDRFKNINDSLGHSVGDLLLQEVARRLQTFGREQDTVARLGGDEFLVVISSVKEVSDAAVAADRLVKAMTSGFDIQGHPITVTCSLGISIFPEHGMDGETLIRNADAAMYCAKESGRNNFQFFAQDMNAQAVERLTLENSLRQALDKKELFLMYQPQMDIATRKIIGLEALLRWQHPERGLVPPDKFIRIAEYSGLIVPIGEWVLRTACSQARKWQDEGLPPVSVAVNVSAVQFRQEDFCERIRRVLSETRLAPQYLELELTESLLLANADVMLSVVEELNAMGLTLAIDDFGTGYSNFGYLRQFRVSKLKIDRSFIRDVAANSNDAAIASAIIGMSKSLNLKVLAEGVEDEAQMTFLRAHQCDEIQGYYFSKPLAVDKVAEKLRGDSPTTRARAQAGGQS